MEKLGPRISAWKDVDLCSLNSEMVAFIFHNEDNLRFRAASKQVSDICRLIEFSLIVDRYEKGNFFASFPTLDSFIGEKVRYDKILEKDNRYVITLPEEKGIERRERVQYIILPASSPFRRGRIVIYQNRSYSAGLVGFPVEEVAVGMESSSTAAETLSTEPTHLHVASGDDISKSTYSGFWTHDAKTVKETLDIVLQEVGG